MNKSTLIKVMVMSIFSLGIFGKNVNSQPVPEVEKIILISTSYGDMKVKLYNETPKHRDNFVKLAQKGYFDGTLFHRVIKSFMIQGGDPNSKDAKPNEMLGNGGPDYTIPAEFDPKLFHKKGALLQQEQKIRQKHLQVHNSILFRVRYILRHNWLDLVWT